MAETTTQQQPFPKAKPGKEHEWLTKLVGEWTYEGEAPPEPGKPAERFTGVERVRSLSGIWFVAEGEGAMPGGGRATTLLTLGYDPRKGHYVGTWIGSMMTHLWVYHGGEVDATGQSLTLHSEGPDMSGGDRMAQYRDVIEFRSDDHRVLTGHMLDDDGNWQEMMSVNYRRKK